MDLDWFLDLPSLLYPLAEDNVLQTRNYPEGSPLLP